MSEVKPQKNNAAHEPLNSETLSFISEALSRTIGAITRSHGADCTLYAEVGSRMLREFGHPAKVVMGSAAWRVGPGDGDVISHALEVNQPGSQVFAINQTGEVNPPVGLFHAWIEVNVDSGAHPGVHVLDFTTGALPEKAAQLDAADGGKTSVEFHPDYLFVNKKDCTSFKGVVNGYDAGVFNYVRHEKIERAITAENVSKMDLDQPTQVALMAFRSLQAGNDIRVVGLESKGGQTLDSVKAVKADKANIKAFRIS